jgi:NADPH:quinone reductase
MTDHAIRLHRFGGPEVLCYEAVDVPAPGPAEAQLRHTAIGLNFIDTYHRSGLYPLALPAGLGLEAAGVVETVGRDVTDLKPGDRVCYCWGPVGAYATRRVIAANLLVKLPDAVDDETAAAMLLKGCTAEYLIARCAPVAAGDTVLVHAAAGGVGLIMGQWLKALGVIAIGTASTKAKRDLASQHGYAHMLGYDDVARQVREITGGTGVAVVYDGVGADTWMASLDSCRVRGTIVSFGNASGPVTGVDLGILSAKGGLYVTRPTLFHYYGTLADRVAGAAAVFARLADGRLSARIDQRYALAAAAQAHVDLEARRTTGASLMLP